MPETGSNFMDWQQVEKDSLLFVDADFSWSEPPRRGRRRMTEDAAPIRGRVAAEQPIRAQRRTALLEYEPQRDDYHRSYDGYAQAPPAEEERWDRPTTAHSHFDEMMQEWNANYGSGASRELGTPAERAFDLADPGVNVSARGARRTVLITGRGDDRYLPAPRQRRASELRFHERSTFSPDRAGLWAVLLGIALVIGAIAH